MSPFLKRFGRWTTLCIECRKHGIRKASEISGGGRREKEGLKHIAFIDKRNLCVLDKR